MDRQKLRLREDSKLVGGERESSMYSFCKKRGGGKGGKGGGGGGGGLDGMIVWGSNSIADFHYAVEGLVDVIGDFTRDVT